MKLNYQMSKKMLLNFRKILILALLALCTNTVSWGQNQRITIASENKTLLQIFEEIEKQTGLSIAYNQTKLDVDKQIGQKFNNKSLSSVMTEVLKNTGFSYRIEGKHIIITPAKAWQSEAAQATGNPKKVSGVILDATGFPIIGANVVIKGTTNGVISDLDGNFALEVPQGSKLQISYIGYLTKEITIDGNNTNYNIQLLEDSQALDEVVIVGYGSEKKVNVIGSIAQIGGDKVTNRPTSMLSNALAGQMAGVTVIQRSGRPGNNGAEIRIRGVASFGGEDSSKADALVLIDGIPGSLNDINAEDVESISVLKDASTAAIYGARAANGVILVTTKTGKEGKISISYNGYVGFNQPTELPEFVDTWRYAELLNEAKGTEFYSKSEIQKLKDGSDPDLYGNHKYLDEIFSRKGIQTGHDLTLNGGTSSNRYLLSFGYLHEDGIIEKNNYERFNTRLNLVTDILSNLTITTRLSGVYATRKEPTADGTSTMLDMVGAAIRTPGLWATRLSNGELGLGNKSNGTPATPLYTNSFFEEPDFKVNANIRLDYSPIKDLKLSAIGGFNYQNQEQRTYKASWVLEGKNVGTSSLKHEMLKTIYKTFQTTAEYNKTFGEHSFGILAGYSWEDQSYRTLNGYRDKFPGNDLPYLNAGSPDNQQSGGGGYDWAIQSLFGRVKYNFAERYLFESTLRYDGSSRFPTNQKYGFFPSIAAGWRISEENFFKENENLSWISNLKLKASWGKLGNQNIGNYPWQTVFNLGKDYPFGDNFALGAAVATATDPTIKWEETQTYDAGFESIFWNGMLSLNASYFYRNTYDILYKPSESISSVLGQKISVMNTGKLRNTGWEFEIGHRNTIGNVSYNINGNFSIINNKVISLGVGDVEQLNGMVGNGSDLFIGYPMDMYYGYLTDGVFISDEEVKEWADVSQLLPQAQKGDIRYKDISGPDGVPDGKVDPNYDRVYLGSRIPKYTFGLNLGAEYKGFDLAMQIQGVAGVKGLLNGFAGWALCGEGNVQTWQDKGHFDPANPQRYPSYPRMQEVTGAEGFNTLTSDFWILDASYIRLKNIQVGYTLPSSIMKKAGISRLRFYVAAENPCSWNKYRKGWDPEINGNGVYYPILTTYTFGVNLKF